LIAFYILFCKIIIDFEFLFLVIGLMLNLISSVLQQECKQESESLDKGYITGSAPSPPQKKIAPSPEWRTVLRIFISGPWEVWSVAAARGPESMATESAGPVSVPSTPSPEGKPSFVGEPGTLGPAGPLQVGVPLGYPSGLAGPTGIDTKVTGQKLLLSPPDTDHPHTTNANLAPSVSGVPGSASVGTPAAAAGERPSPAAQQQLHSLQPHTTVPRSYTNSNNQ